MNTGQMMLTLGAMILLSFLVLRVNSSQLTIQDSMQTSKFGILAVSLASSIIEQASHKHFDEATIGEFVDDVKLLTLPKDLKLDTGESYPDNIDDFDDYNTYSFSDSTMPSAVFDIRCEVGYVETSAPDVVVNKRTFHKKLSVYVSSESMQDTITITSLFSYWKFP